MEREAMEGAIDFAASQGGAAPTSRIGLAGYTQGVLNDWLNGRINNGSSLGARGWMINKFIQSGAGASFIVPFADKGSGEVDLTPFYGTGSATFTRATTATTVNSSGLIVSVASGVPRSYYDPTTLQYRGYLAEGQRQNLSIRSSEFDGAAWAKNSCTVSANSVTAPDGTLTADTIVSAAATAITGVNNSIGTFSAVAHSQGFFVKKASGVRYVQLLWTNASVSSEYLNFDLDTGAIAGGSYSGGFVQSFPNGWYRISMVSTVGAVAGGQWIIAVPSASSLRGATYAGNGTDGFSLWGAQVEAASFPSTYIPTTVSAQTRNADVLTYPASGNVSDTQGTVYAEIMVPLGNTSELGGVALVGTGTDIVRLMNNGANYAMQVFDNGVLQANISPGAVIQSSVQKIAGSYAVNNFVASLSGGAAVTDNSGTLGTFQSISMSSGVSSYHFGTIRNLRIWQNQFSAEQLQTITA